MNEHYERGTLRLLRYIYNQMERCRNLDFGNLDITSSQASVMLFLFKNRSQQVTQQNVQNALMLSHPTITGLMQRLETKGFIQRISDPQDARCKAVELTPKGEDIEKALKNNTRAMEQRALHGLTTEELTILDYCLRTIAGNLRQSEEEANEPKASSHTLPPKAHQQKTAVRQRAPRV